MSTLAIAPIFTHLLTTILCFVLWKFPRGQKVVSVLGAAVSLAVAITMLIHVDNTGKTLVVCAGGWMAPYGICFVADTFSAIMVLLNAIIGAATVVYSLGAVDERRQKYGYHALTHALLAACSGAFLAGDLFNIYVWFEIMLMSSFVLLTLGGERGQLEGAIKYVTLNLFSSTIFLTGLGLLYGIVGTLNIADIGAKLATLPSEDLGLVTTVAVLFFVAYGIKAGLFPFFFWLPASYHTPPPAVSALFAGMLTKVGVYVLIRVFVVIFNHDPGFFGPVVTMVAALTMLSGVLGAAAQFEIRRILSFHIVSQIGYMIMGLGLFITAGHRADLARAAGDVDSALVLESAATIGLTGSIFYILHHIIVKANLFFVGGVVQHLRGTGELRLLGGLYRRRPMLGLCFMIPAMSLAGIPILSGFWAKLTLVRSAVQAEAWWILGTALFVSVLTLYSMTKIWAEAFWKDPEGGDCAEQVNEPDRPFTLRQRMLMMGPICALALLTLCIGFGAGPAYALAERATDRLTDLDRYRDAVFSAVRDELEAHGGGHGAHDDDTGHDTNDHTGGEHGATDDSVHDTHNHHAGEGVMP